MRQTAAGTIGAEVGSVEVCPYPGLSKTGGTLKSSAPPMRPSGRVGRRRFNVGVSGEDQVADAILRRRLGDRPQK